MIYFNALVPKQCSSILVVALYKNTYEIYFLVRFELKLWLNGL